jgi:AhpD family alkylhydroperoxidase
MSDIEEIKKMRKGAHDFLLAKKSEVYEKFVEMEKATYKDGAVSKKNKELIAVGISVVTNCEACMQWHVEEALMCGASEEEVIEAIEVSMEMGCGPATANARFALAVLDRFIQKKGPSSL